MSDSDFFAAMHSTTTSVPFVARPETASAASRRWWPVALLAAVAVVALGAAALHLRPHSVDTRPVVLPATFDGLPPAPAAQQFAQSGDWRTVVAPDYAGSAFDGRAYGTRSPLRLLNVVVARTDGTDIGDVRLGAAPFVDYGDVRCTRTFQLPGQSPPDRPSDTRLLCFRAERALTVSVLGLSVTPDADAAIAAAVDDLWARQG